MKSSTVVLARSEAKMLSSRLELENPHSVRGALNAMLAEIMKSQMLVHRFASRGRKKIGQAP